MKENGKQNEKSDDLYTVILKIYYTLYTIKLKVSLSHTHRDGKDKLLEWPDRSCLLLYGSARIH